MTDDIAIRELAGFDEIRTIYPLIRQSNATLDEALFATRLEAMLDEGGYRCVVAYRDGRLAGVSGFWVGTRLWCGSYIEPDNVVVDNDQRGLGIGAKLMAWIEAEGERMGCEVMKLEMHIGNEGAHAFYRRVAFCDDGLVLVKALIRGAAAFPEYAGHLTEAS